MIKSYIHSLNVTYTSLDITQKAFIILITLQLPFEVSILLQL